MHLRLMMPRRAFTAGTASLADPGHTAGTDNISLSSGEIVIGYDGQMRRSQISSEQAKVKTTSAVTSAVIIISDP